MTPNLVNILTLSQFLNLLNDPLSQVDFNDSIALIDSIYDFTPTAFSNGNAISAAEQNQGSCKIFSFAQLLNLDEQQTLRCFGRFYQSVIESPSGDDHQNIRQFMLHGWNSVVFEGHALNSIKSTSSAIEAP